MEPRKLYLFPDTNLFIQCKPLEELDWSAQEEFAEINLLVCRAVQREIDGQKNRGRDRIADRARKTSTLFRDVLSMPDRQMVIRERSPKVTLSFCSIQLPSKDLKDRLDYNHADDEILGVLYAFVRTTLRRTRVCSLMTLVPMVTADHLGLEYIAISDKWLLPPENNPLEKENQQLKDEVRRLTSLEPAFEVDCLSHEGQRLDKLESKFTIYLPLGEDEIEELIALLKRRSPMVTNLRGRLLQPNLPQWTFAK